jgi:hypothetical protein
LYIIRSAVHVIVSALRNGEYPGPDSNRHGLAAKGF